MGRSWEKKKQKTIQRLEGLNGDYIYIGSYQPYDLILDMCMVKTLQMYMGYVHPSHARGILGMDMLTLIN